MKKPSKVPEYVGPACSTMHDRLKDIVRRGAEGWAHHAFLRDGATHLIEAFGTVEDALLACMFYQTMLAELEGL